MYKVFINDSFLIIDLPELSMSNHNNLLQIRLNENEAIEPYVHLLENQPGCRGFYLQHPKPNVLIARLEQQYPVVNAAGGLVMSPAGKLLMIFRKGCWDLPKGKAEGSERTRETALREVVEECGIPKPHSAMEFFTTRHFYRENNSGFIKKSVWFMMEVDSDNIPLFPQAEEDITRAIWCSKEEYLNLRKDCYPSVRELIERLWVVD